jgi:tetratricopeptide (TPR) repeat protein
MDAASIASPGPPGVRSNAEIDRLWWRGELLAAYQMSLQLAHVPSGAPFRGGHGSLDDAERWHAHGARAWHLARFDDAARNLDAAYQIRRTALGDTHPATLVTLGRLAALADYTDHADLARQRFEQTIDGWVAVEGKKSVDVAIARRNYACLLRSRGDRETARRLLYEADRVFRKRVRDDDPEYLALRKAYALLATCDGHHDEAVRSSEEAIERTRLPHDHPFVAAAYLTLARSRQRLGQLDAARDLLREVIASFERGYGEHPMLAIAFELRADLLLELGDMAEAVDATRRWITIYSQFYALKTFSFGPTACFRLAAVGLVGEAQAIAERMVELAPEKAHACFAQIGGAYLRRGDQAGFAWLERAAALARPADRSNYLVAIAGWRKQRARDAARS